MKLYKTYIKLILNKNKMNYLFVILSMIASIIAIAIISIYIENILVIGMNRPMKNLRYIFGSIQTVFCLAAASFVLNQYYNILKTNIRDYSVLKAFGVTKHDFRILIFLEVMLLIIITIPLGVISAVLVVSAIIEFMINLAIEADSFLALGSSFISITISAVISIFVIVIGIKMERGIRSMSPSQILSENSVFGKEL